jgi:hypothetical protein
MDDMDRLLAEISALDKKLPPVADWHPERNTAMDIRIDCNGQWFHEGDIISRHEMARLFSSILRKDPDGYCLVTPVERCLIQVDDVPFVAHLESVQGNADQQEIFMRTNMDDLVRIDADHPLRMKQYAGSHVPYIRVRAELEARVDRAAYYQLVNCMSERDGASGLMSAGSFFVMGA